MTETIKSKKYEFPTDVDFQTARETTLATLAEELQRNYDTTGVLPVQFLYVPIWNKDPITGMDKETVIGMYIEARYSQEEITGANMLSTGKIALDTPDAVDDVATKLLDLLGDAGDVIYSSNGGRMPTSIVCNYEFALLDAGPRVVAAELILVYPSKIAGGKASKTQWKAIGLAVGVPASILAVGGIVHLATRKGKKGK